MEQTKFKYGFSNEEVNYLLNAVNRQQISGVAQAKELLYVVELLQKPINSEELEKEQLKNLQEKYVKKDK